ncbi:PKD domain-containing protein [Halopelagius fulvigenes]|uniref:Ig-like domain-containing protein n=1 Tax=Halopelagius fulvigenes TaxID=1198324 RepID=A0ABD5TTH9_9EURY
MKYQTLIAVVASVGVVATAAFVGGVGADIGVPSTDDVASSVEAVTTGASSSEQTATSTASTDRTTTEASSEEDSAGTDSTGTESTAAPTGTEAATADSAANATDSSETNATDAESSANASAENASAENASVENNTAPVAAVSADGMVHERTRVELDAAASRDADGDELNYTWTQVSGPDAEWVRNDTATASVVSPDVAVWTDVTFRVTVTDARGATDTANVTITVRSTEYEDETADTSADGSAEDESEETTASNSSDSSDANASATYSRDELSRAVFGSDFDALGTADAAAVEELYLRQPSGEWDPAEVRSRDEIARDRYNASFEELGFDARVDVQEAFDAQFDDTGENAAYSRDELAQAEWGYNFSELSPDSAAKITEMYDRQPFAEDQELAHVRTRDQFARYLYDSELGNLTREQRLDVERHYHDQFTEN